MRVLTLDTATATNKRLGAAGHTVIAAPFGYGDGHRHLYEAPHEVDAIVFDLQTPACFDISRWGPYGGNDNFKCHVVPSDELTWEKQRVGIGGAAYDRPRYKLIQDTQIRGMGAYEPSPFGPDDIRMAIERAGVPLIIFLNHQWTLRTGGVEFPNIFGASWMTSDIRSERFTVAAPLDALLPAIPSFSPRAPIRCAIGDGPRARASKATVGTTKTIVTDRIDNSLGELVTLGNGYVWVLPEMIDNADVCVQLLAAIEQGGRSVTQAAAPPEVAVDETYDVFISHASEDKTDFVDPLAQMLFDRGVRVWYDRFILKPGDSLSGKIDDGLKRSRFGLLVLSHSFFAKRWPESEYRALLAMGRRLIPVWHNVDHEDVAQFSPLLLDRFAIRSDFGVRSAARQVIDVVRPDLMVIDVGDARLTANSENIKYENYDLAPYHVGGPDVPTDALPWQPFVANFQPCLDIRFAQPRQISAGQMRWGMDCEVTNVGAGTARAIQLFLPYLDVVAIDSLEAGQKQNEAFCLDDRHAFWNFVKFPAQAVFEYEDISGFLYRQYGSIDQSPVPSGAFYAFTLRAIGKPYRVKGRIVKPDFPDSWRTPI